MPPRSPKTAIVLAAGLGKRMLPITATMPKPLVKVGGRSLIDFALDRLAEAGIETVVVNVHHFADMLEDHLRTRKMPHIVVSDERAEVLETGGGVRKALPLLGDGPFITFNSDSMWIEGREPNLRRLVSAWDPDRMDILMLVAPLSTSVGYEGRGDFSMDPDGRLRRRRGDEERVPFVYAGVAIVKPELVADTPEGPFSANLFYDRAIAKDRLYGLQLDGQWLHVGEPQAIPVAEECLAASLR
ncbi:nucleotidyltransferase family protein [Microvirga lenta]|uniref:nucleotidyltransferase family protein n=1 Tax=Microvirga lenta TaxID=2881337 RepID=UPI001CFFD09C|nr:nucleotidyltransferase family protein [Microvirga lenta]MCB5174956.1 nucleotidyltransferase family protein [Microvirga lenta]